MTKKDLIAKLKDGTPTDPEDDHGNAEGWLLEFVNDEEVLTAWMDRKDRVGWWYA